MLASCALFCLSTVALFLAATEKELQQAENQVEKATAKLNHLGDPETEEQCEFEVGSPKSPHLCTSPEADSGQGSPIQSTAL